jgi:hypothetical protein
MGRKARAGKANDNILRIRMTNEEREQIDTAAAPANTSAWARKVLLKASSKRPRPRKPS